MYNRCSFLLFFVFVLTISWLARATSNTKAFNNLLLDQLTKSCPSDGIPVCGIRNKQLVLFSNGCLLNEANKDILQSEKNIRKVPLEDCMSGCKFSCPNIYEPVCGRNIKTYQNQLFRNQCELMKYACKTNMDYLNISQYECSSKFLNFNKLLEKRSQTSRGKGSPVACINIFSPVCGSYMGVKSSFQNECLLNAENVDFNRDWRIVNYGVCPEDYSKDRRSTENPTIRHLIKKRSYRNNLYNQIEYNTNNFVDNKNEHNIVPNDLYVYMPAAFQEQYPNHGASSYQHSMPEHKTYDQIFNNIETFSPPDMPFPLEEGKKLIGNLISKKNTFNPMSFDMNGINIKYLSDENLANGIKGQSIMPHIEPFTGVDKKEYYYAFAKIDPTMQSVKVQETIPDTNGSTKAFNEQEGGKVTGNKLDCKFGSVSICAALADGTVRTFETICEMMTANVYFKNTWTKLHEGTCENCKSNCLRDYQPVCVSRNGVNYTMANECYYNMAICMDKISKWQKLVDNECERYTRIPDKYANAKPGFPYTSNYFVSETTPMSSTVSLALGNTTSPKSFKKKSSKSKKRRPNFKRAISSSRCCPESYNNNENFSGEHLKCECDSSEKMQTSFTTESHIMDLVKETR